jgi:O-antigen/teichoic acid export membrane protein
MEALRSRLLRNSALNLTSYALGPLAGLICLPITFRELGPERFALLTLLWAILTYGTLFDFGVGRGVARASAAALADLQHGRILTVSRFAISFQLIVGMLAGITIVVLTPVILRTLNVPASYHSEMTSALRVLALCLPLLLIHQSLQGVLEAFERFDLLALVRTPLNVATYAFPAIGAVAGWSLADILTSILIVRVAATLALLALHRRLLSAPATPLSKADVKEIVHFSGWLSVSVVVIGIMVYLDRLILAAVGDLNMVAQYVAPYDLAAKLLIIPASVSAVYFPYASKALAGGKVLDSLRQVRKARAILTCAMLLPSAFLVFMAPQTLHLLLGPGIGPVGVACFRILIIATLLHASAFIPVVLIEAAGRADVVAKYHVVELVVYIGVLIVFVRLGGATGAAWAWLARSAWLAIWAHVYIENWGRSHNTNVEISPVPSIG